MATNLHLDDRLIDKARRLGRHRTKREAVTRALTEYVQHLGQQKMTEDDKPDSLVAHDRKGNHPDDRNALFRSGDVKRILERDWRWRD